MICHHIHHFPTRRTSNRRQTASRRGESTVGNRGSSCYFATLPSLQRFSRLIYLIVFLFFSFFFFFKTLSPLVAIIPLHPSLQPCPPCCLK
ncbi:hypothetical protein ASPVEDRAFT_752763 [Aspergillus versicolor CBS 583.65]|uniref:Uncharacterized protein n=1 Tax=Aspergillus versicolor CBS 583.65 TaxID=1036611 RepID=A0A1L9PQF6_ASPVE|nr:uncharacterized protein ASPVEDRAFT_752763 [Aspergillus versicolor CBS 583.65]OJJ03749.1 hypothetical protein ASPVEDRAFT_752763 [Aspergillus versicolor CBS 583.65]